MNEKELSSQGVSHILVCNTGPAFAISHAPFRIVVEYRKALSLDANQASAHPRTGGCPEEHGELIAVDR